MSCVLRAALRARSDLLPGIFTFPSQELIFGGDSGKMHVILQCFLMEKTPTFCFSSGYW